MFNTNDDNGGWLFLLVILIVLGGFGVGNRGGEVATQQSVYDATNQQTINNKLDSIANGICSSGYENARLIDTVNYNNMQNTNTITSAMNNGFSNVSYQINELSHQMQDCCCNLRSQMLQDKYEDVQRQLEQAQGVIANSVQTNNILSQLGRFYTYPALGVYGTTIA